MTNDIYNLIPGDCIEVVYQEYINGDDLVTAKGLYIGKEGNDFIDIHLGHTQAIIPITYIRDLKIISRSIKPDRRAIRGKEGSRDKPKYSLVPPEVEELVAMIRTYGNTKHSPGTYTDENWKTVEPPEQYLDAALRHINAHRQGISHDDESGFLHVGMAISNLQMYAARLLENKPGKV